MRSFRDNWLKLQPGGETKIREYYRTAPQIVEAVNARRDSVDIYVGVYRDFIRPCVLLVQKEDNETAYRLYCEMVETLSKLYLK